MGMTTDHDHPTSEFIPTEERLVPATLSRFASGAALLAGHGAAIGRVSTTLAAESVRIALGRSSVEPARGDKRFSDPTWRESAVFHRLAQSYLASCRAMDDLVDALDESSWSHAETARFLSRILSSAFAPTNALLTNPAALKRAFETGGRSVASGVANWVTDVRDNGGMPTTAKEGRFTVGEDLAASPGSVIAQSEIAELIQYRPTTEKVYERPTLVVPPPIGRFYFLDLAPGRSFVEYSVSRGIQTFMMSWRNPTKEQATWGIDTYAQAVLDAVEDVRQATGQEDVNLVGFCAGGLLSSLAINHLAAQNAPGVHSATYAVTLLDFGGTSPMEAFKHRPVLSAVGWNSRRKGIVDARAMGSAFTWLRPDDLVFNYWVNNYLMGLDPPAFDILSWNADGTNLPARLHAEFLDIFRHNPLPQSGAREYLGTPLDLDSIDMPKFVLGAVSDHITPWRGTYRTTQLMRGDSTFVLSNAGHIASLVNPPDNAKASYFAGTNAGAVDAETWLTNAQRCAGSWWVAWADWTSERAGAQLLAPGLPGTTEQPPLAAAPGHYVFG